MTWTLPEEVVGEPLNEVQRQYAPSEIKMLLRLAGFKNIEIYSCADGVFSKDTMKIDDIEMLVLAKKDDSLLSLLRCFRQENMLL
jgi:hypothetical protein